MHVREVADHRKRCMVLVKASDDALLVVQRFASANKATRCYKMLQDASFPIRTCLPCFSVAGELDASFVFTVVYFVLLADPPTSSAYISKTGPPIS